MKGRHCSGQVGRADIKSKDGSRALGDTSAAAANALDPRKEEKHVPAEGEGIQTVLLSHAPMVVFELPARQKEPVSKASHSNTTPPDIDAINRLSTQAKSCPNGHHSHDRPFIPPPSTCACCLAAICTILVGALSALQSRA